jgi:hypothetical protein
MRIIAFISNPSTGRDIRAHLRNLVGRANARFCQKRMSGHGGNRTLPLKATPQPATEGIKACEFAPS